MICVQEGESKDIVVSWGDVSKDSLAEVFKTVGCVKKIAASDGSLMVLTDTGRLYTVNTMSHTPVN